jgi:hypothetical protein
MIYIGKDPQQILWDITKELSLTHKIPIYKETMHEEPKDTPNSYILLRSEITDTDELKGDGKTLTRYADCDIILVSKGYADDTTDLHNINKALIKKHLQSQGIAFQGFNLGYDDALKSTQYTFSLGVEYIGTED